MLPLNKQIGFFSDAYCLEWVYAKSVIVRRVLAEVLDKRVKRGQYSYDDALNIAQRILLDTPKTLLSWPA